MFQCTYLMKIGISLRSKVRRGGDGLSKNCPTGGSFF